MTGARSIGLNVRQEASSKSQILGLLLRDSVIDVGEHSPDKKWARIAKVVEGGIESVRPDGSVPPAAAQGWVFLAELDPDPAPNTFDEVVTLDEPYPIRQGDVMGYLGEDVPSRASPIANQPVSRRLLHLEVFSTDGVPAYLAASRQWAASHLADQDRTLLVLRPGDTLHVEPNGAVACTLNWAQILPLSALEVKEIGGQRWRKVGGMTLANGQVVAGWAKESGHLASPWEWPGFDVVDERNSESGGIFDDLAAWAGFIKKEAPRPEETPFYQQLRRMLDTDKDGQISEDELDAALRNRSKAAHIARIIVRHDSEWAMEPAKRQQDAVASIAELLGFDAVRRVQEEMPRAQKLPWWDEVAAGVAGFPKSPRVYHFHAGGVAGNFLGRRESGPLAELIRQIGDIISHGEGGYESYNTGTKDVPGKRVGHSFLRPPPGTVTGKSINEILATDPLSGTDRNRMFATGKYQTILSTLRTAKQVMGLTGDEKYDADMQERVFAEYLIDKAGGGDLARYVKYGKGTIDDAQYAAAKEWASIAAPSGKTIRDGRVSDGSLSHYESPANRANAISTRNLRAILQKIHDDR